MTVTVARGMKIKMMSTEIDNSSSIESSRGRNRKSRIIRNGDRSHYRCSCTIYRRLCLTGEAILCAYLLGILKTSPRLKQLAGARADFDEMKRALYYCRYFLFHCCLLTRWLCLLHLTHFRQPPAGQCANLVSLLRTSSLPQLPNQYWSVKVISC